MSGSMWSRIRKGFFFCVIAAAAMSAVPAAATDEEGCYRCHGLRGFSLRQGDSVNDLTISAGHFDSSVHSPLSCRECHSDIASIPHPDAELRVSCGQTCHQQKQSGEPYSHETLFWEYTTSVHGEGEDGGIPCMVCHPAGSLAEMTRRDLLHEVRQCAACHRERGHVQDYFQGFHFFSLARGNRGAPSCPDCHSSHRVLSPDEEESTVHHGKVAATCSTGAIGSSPGGRCHGNIGEGAALGAPMIPLPLPGSHGGPALWIFSFLYWGMLGGLLARVGIGLVRKR